MANKVHRNILVVERNPELRSKFFSAFQESGYRVQVAEEMLGALSILNRGVRDASAFDLVVLDVAESKALGHAMNGQNITVPFLTVKNVSDKLLMIDLLSQHRSEFIENYIKYHERN